MDLLILSFYKYLLPSHCAPDVKLGIQSAVMTRTGVSSALIGNKQTQKYMYNYGLW